MNYCPLGKSALKVSQIAFGCMSLGDDDAVNVKLLRAAFDNGITLFDTADLYAQGQNEKTLGKAFLGIRDKVIIATKVGNQWRNDGSGWDWNPTKKYIVEAVEKSLARLQTDYIDLYQLHGGTIEDPIDETIEAFEQLKHAGKIRTYGISSIRPNVIREYVKRSSIDSVMMQYSVLDRRPEEACLDLLYQNKISVLVRGGLAQGILINKAPSPYLNHTQEDVKKAKDAVKSIAGKTAYTTSVSFSLSPPAVAATVVGIRNEAQLKDALLAADSSPLTEEEIAYLKNETVANRYEQHR